MSSGKRDSPALGSTPDLQEPDRRFTYSRLRGPFRWALSGCGALDKKYPAARDGFCVPAIGRVTLAWRIGHFPMQPVRRDSPLIVGITTYG